MDDVTRWNFRQIIPCHFAAPVKAGPREFRCAMLPQALHAVSMCGSLCGRQGEAASLCRAAFEFAYDDEGGPVSAALGAESLLTRILRRPGKPAAAELPAGDMRALDSLARILRTVGVLNK